MVLGGFGLFRVLVTTLRGKANATAESSGNWRKTKKYHARTVLTYQELT